LNEDFVLATADTPDSQVEDTKVDQPVEQNSDATEAPPVAAAPEAAAESAPVTEAPVAEAAPVAAEATAEVSETPTEETAPEVVAEATAEVVEPAPEAATEAAPADAEADTAVAVAEKPESELTMEDLLEQYLPSKILRRGEIIDGKVMSRKPEGMLVDIGYKSEGFVPTKEMRSLTGEGVEELSIGDEIIAYVVNPEGSEGSSILSIDRARGEQGWRVLEKAMDNNETCKGVITGSNRGGAVVESEGVQGFVRFRSWLDQLESFMCLAASRLRKALSVWKLSSRLLNLTDAETELSSLSVLHCRLGSRFKRCVWFRNSPRVRSVRVA